MGINFIKFKHIQAVQSKIRNQIYNSNNFWYLKWRHDHGFVPKLLNGESYRQLYYNYKRCHDPKQYFDLKDFAKRVYSGFHSDQFFYINFDDNFYEVKLFPTLEVTPLINSVSDIIINEENRLIYNRDSYIYYIDFAGKLWKEAIDKYRRNLVIDDKPIRQIVRSNNAIFALNTDNQLIKINEGHQVMY